MPAYSIPKPSGRELTKVFRSISNSRKVVDTPIPRSKVKLAKEAIVFCTGIIPVVVRIDQKYSHITTIGCRRASR